MKVPPARRDPSGPVLGGKDAPSIKQRNDIFALFEAAPYREGLEWRIPFILGNDDVDQVHSLF